jgi:hypothetical protein
MNKTKEDVFYVLYQCLLIWLRWRGLLGIRQAREQSAGVRWGVSIYAEKRGICCQFCCQMMGIL